MSRARSAAVAAIALVVTAGGCAHKKIETQAFENGMYRVRCRAPLSVCLSEGVDPLCQYRSYLVVRAIDEHNLRGISTWPHDDRSSEVLVRCGPERGWGAIGDKPMESTVAECQASAPRPQGPPETPRPRACVPGASQSCVGPAGCAGGQACLPDGSAFGPCDCGGPAAPPAAAAH